MATALTASALVGTLLLTTACAPERNPHPAGTASAPAGTASAPAPAAPAATPAGAEPSGAPPFTGTARPATAADVPRSWRAGCPVGPDQLRVLRLAYWDFAAEPQVGTLIAHRDVADGLITVFGSLYAQRFPIRLLRPVDAYDGSDDASMAADNTSAFNCRRAVAAGTPSWSEHAYGKAIDVNPVENPYLFDGRVLPPAGSAYTARGTYRPGMATAGGVLVRAFAAAGWKWGGTHRSPDYQHFSTSGN